ncbi:3-isopropylmalate dehydratase small subunit [Nitrospirillum iridis]|uniref:3-isopropylmalate dehydratase n=1 Tax=Nitrospirillum iridis TaxID=765888 RepID=A0A7X0B2K3_9PROT|nr:3-isopropylmalate dehydratase small subunit [Nitrospirillum iridis]MBB6253059.1 3-isopropylmalate/(R)-2-methylmalate dehydratase small subunit [Nitrospirillum iridis]
MIQPFIRVDGPAAALPEENVDTDIIYPARFLLITARLGLGPYAFHDRRFRADGTEVAEFVLNRPEWREAPILVAGANFGSGSSREQAVWALLGRGIRCVIAPSFGEIFQANCYRNGVLPITLPPAQVAALSAAAAAAHPFAVDLEAGTVTVAGRPPIPFSVDLERRLALLNGWDETATLLNAYGADIGTFEERHRRHQPWLFEGENDA